MGIHSKILVEEQVAEVRRRVETLVQAMQANPMDGVLATRYSRRTTYEEDENFHNVNAANLRLAATDLITFISELKKRLGK